MKKCPFCAEEIQDEAMVCRFCNRDQPNIGTTQTPPQQKTKARPFVSLVVGIAGFLGIILFFNLMEYDSDNCSGGSKSTDGPSTEGATDGPSKEGAIAICEKSVKEHLKAPRSAKFCGSEETKAMPNGVGSWKVEGCVDSQNSFGALIRARWKCEATHEKGTTWKVGSQLLE